MSVLYELGNEQKKLYAQLEDAQTEDEAYGILNELFHIEQDITANAGELARFRLNLMGEVQLLRAKAALFKAEAERIEARAAEKDRYAERIEKEICFGMQCAGLQRIRTDIGMFYLQQTTKVNVLDATSVPNEYTIPQPPKIDKAKIRKAFAETGEILPGVEIQITKGVRFR